MPAPPTFDVRLSREEKLAPNVRGLELERVDGAPFAFEAGQWVSLVLPLAEGEARRAYSIASAPNDSPRFEIAVTKVEGGAGSTYLHEMPIGGTLRVIGPQGFFTRGGDHPSLFIGTGTGITPLRSMIQRALANGHTAPMRLVVGARFESDRLYLHELEAIAAKHPQFQFAYTLSQGAADWTGLRGYVQTHVERLWSELVPFGAPHAYICGLERMVGTVRDLLRKTMLVDRKQVHSERYD